MSKSYYPTDPYPHTSRSVADKFSINDYFQRFDQLINEQKFNKYTTINNIFHMLDEVQPHFGDTVFNACYYLKLIEELEKLQKECPPFAHDFKNFLETNRSFANAFIQHVFDKLHTFTKDELFAFMLSACQFPITFTHDQQKCIHQAIHIHLSSFNGAHFCNSLELLTHLKETPNTHWQKEWVNAFFDHKNEMDPAMLTYIADRIDMFASDITHELVKDLANYKTQHADNAEPIQKISLHAHTNTKLDEITSEVADGLASKDPISSVSTMSIEHAHQKKKTIKPKDIISELKTFVHTTGEIYEGKINFFNRHLKKCFPDLSRKEIIKIIYLYALLHIDKNHALPILKRAKAYFETCDNLFENIEESEFRKLIIAKRYFNLLGFHIDITHHANFEGYLSNLKKWVIKTRIQSKPQKYVEKIVKPYLPDIEAESYIDAACDCCDLFSPSSNLILEVDSDEYHTLSNNSPNPKDNLITQLKTFLLEKHGYHLIRLNVDTIRKEGRPYILSKIAPFIRGELEILQNDYIQELYEHGGKHSYSIIGTNVEKHPGFLNYLEPLRHVYQIDNPDHQRTLSNWMDTMLSNMKCQTCGADRFLHLLSDLTKLIHWDNTLKEATYTYFNANPTFQKTIIEQSLFFFDQFNLQDFIAFLDYARTIKLPLTEEILETWCLYYVEPMLKTADEKELGSILKLFINLNFKPTQKFTDAFFNATKNRVDLLGKPYIDQEIQRYLNRHP